MSDDLLLYWKAFNEFFSNEDILRQSPCPLSFYELEFIEGPIIDIGCGQSPVLIKYSTSNRELYAIDNEPYQLESLQKRLVDHNDGLKEGWHFINASFPEQDIPDNQYAVVVLSNYLHFYTLDQCKQLIEKLAEKTTHGSMLYIVVHSTGFYDNVPTRPDNNDYFKHYFSAKDLDSLFANLSFSRTYLATVDRVDTELDERVYGNWFDKVFIGSDDISPNNLAMIKANYLARRSESYIEAIYRRI